MERNVLKTRMKFPALNPQESAYWKELLDLKNRDLNAEETVEKNMPALTYAQRSATKAAVTSDYLLI